MFRNYRNELEIVLDKKRFPKEVKNLLLNMEYKIETSYEDYAIVKRNVEFEEEMLKRIIKILKTCNGIELKEVLPKEERYIEEILEEEEYKEDSDDKSNEEIKNKEVNSNKVIYDEYKVFDLDEDLESVSNITKTNRYEVNHISKTIKVYPNEIDLLEALLDLEDDKIYIRDDYKYYKVAFANIINLGKVTNNIEIIRDFDAWNWNIQREYIPDYIANLIYQNLIILLGYKGVEEWRNNRRTEDNIKTLTNRLEKQYGKEKTTRFLNSAYILSIISCTNRNKKEKYRLIAEKKKLENSIEKLNNAFGYINELSDKKKELIERIQEIDKQLNNYDELIQAFFEINEKLPMYFKIRNVSQYQRKIEKERNQAIKQIEDYNYKSVPKNFVKRKTELESDYKFVEPLEVENVKLPIIIKFVKEVQESFLDCFEVLIENAQTKREVMDLVYMYRYYLFIPCTHSKDLKDIKCFMNKRYEIEELLMNKLYEFRALNLFTGNINLDKKIFTFILNSQIVSLEKIKISILYENDEITVHLYDSNIIEKSLELEMVKKSIDDLEIKNNKRFKVFIK